MNSDEIAEIAEHWAVARFGMERAPTGQWGHDGTLPDGRTLQVKSKKYGAHSESAAYVDLSEEVMRSADSLLVVFVDYETGEIRDHIGPVPVDEVKDITTKRKRYRVTMNRLRKISSDNGRAGRD
ncbi:MAG: hypothetical protein OXC91_07695 [Rhodobacteraceae bacterium]|nr:hypothetical protein [Paracoccaceae bacterium]